MGVAIVLLLLAGRSAALACRAAAGRQVVVAIAVYSAVLGLLVFGVDLLEARTEEAAVEEAARQIRAEESDATIWFVGHWGFQYYAERAGMQAISAYPPMPAYAGATSRILVPGRTSFKEGDWLVLPQYRWSAIASRAACTSSNSLPIRGTPNTPSTLSWTTRSRCKPSSRSTPGFAPWYTTRGRDCRSRCRSRYPRPRGLALTGSLGWRTLPPRAAEFGHVASGPRRLGRNRSCPLVDVRGRHWSLRLDACVRVAPAHDVDQVLLARQECALADGSAGAGAATSACRRSNRSSSPTPAPDLAPMDN